jgi:sugar O-acyltransferase (sialic acid O-acetyltransferase NeuD family)
MFKVAVIGASGHASDVLSLIEHLISDGEAIEVVGLFHSNPDSIDMCRFRGRNVEVMASAEIKRMVNADPELRFVAGVGYPTARRDVVDMFSHIVDPVAALVHRSAAIGTAVELGRGSVVLAQTSISPCVNIGDHSYVSHGALIGHDTIVGDYVSLMPGSSVSGDCWIGAEATIGTNATILEKVKVGEGAVVGAGAVVTGDVEAGVVVVGAPAKPIRSKAVAMVEEC